SFDRRGSRPPSHHRGSSLQVTQSSPDYDRALGDVPGLPPGLAHLVETLLLYLAFLGPLLVLAATGVAAPSVGRSVETRTAPQASAVVVLVTAAALLVLQLTWGDELWVWLID
ncbi:hypothetical protein SAMN06264364_1548, partial [Quadrisphaera granulorum]